MFLLISFGSPYWIQSYDIAYLDFKNMGLWEFCFFNFRYPFNQFDHKFTGCHYVFSDEYRILREWILPPWLQAVQAFVSLAFLCSFSAQLVVALMLMRWPLGLWRRFQYQMALTALFLTLVTVGGLFLAVAVFGGKCWDRDWMMYPNYNFLSWSFYFAIIALALHALAALLFTLEAVRARARLPLLQPDGYAMDAYSVASSYQYPNMGAASISPSPAPYQRVSNSDLYAQQPAGYDHGRY